MRSLCLKSPRLVSAGDSRSHHEINVGLRARGGRSKGLRESREQPSSLIWPPANEDLQEMPLGAPFLLTLTPVLGGEGIMSPC